MDDKACYAIAYAPCAASLRVIDLTRAERITAVAALRMLQRYVLRLFACPHQVPSSFMCLFTIPPSLRSCPSLSVCNLTLCKAISVSEVTLLAQAVPSYVYPVTNPKTNLHRPLLLAVSPLFAPLMMHTRSPRLLSLWQSSKPRRKRTALRRLWQEKWSTTRKRRRRRSLQVVAECKALFEQVHVH